MPQAPDARYRAFISYSHADAAFGRRLHRRLEAYAVPARLAGRAGVPRRLTPIFRDREELPAAGDLSTQVRAALADSAALIVVCSPRAAASPWVGREVALFRELHPDRPILAALIEGEPAQSFPSLLIADGTEPLAADFREGRDGEKLALLKLVAGLVGVGLDELIQRDAQRNLQRVTAVTAGALVGMVAMGGLAAFAFAQQAEAQRQRAEAEGLVDFMMTDLRTRLEGVGRLDVMTAVNQRALDHYEGQNLEGLPTASLLRRVEIVTAMGQDDMRRNDLPRALNQFREARRTTAALLKANSQDSDRVYAHAQSEYWVALVDWRRGDIAAARSGMERYAVLTRALLRSDPQRPDWRMEAGYAESNLGTVELTNPDQAALAEAAFRRSLAHFEAAGRMALAASSEEVSQADVQVEIADAHGWIADCHRMQGEYAQARAERRAEEQILRGLLTRDPRNTGYAMSLQFNLVAQARIDLDEGRSEIALPKLRQALRDAAALAVKDPADKERAMQRIVTGLFLAEAALGQGEREEAVAALADCNTATARADLELRDFCAVLTSRAGAPDADAKAYLRANHDRLAKLRRSQRWGIDFSRELANLTPDT